MIENIKILGNYTEMNYEEEHMIIQFRASTLNIDELWQSGSLSATFLSKFWGKFFPIQEDTCFRADVIDSVRYVAGELIGNAVKFGCEPNFLIKIGLCMSEQELHFYVTNDIKIEDVDKYEKYIQKISDRSPEELYLEQMEKNALDDNNDSCMGFLTIIMDYGAEIAWKFEKKHDLETVTATIMVRLTIVRELQSEGGTDRCV